MKEIGTLTNEEVAIMKSIRDSIPRPTENTWMKKILSIEDLNNYLKEGWDTAKGYVSVHSNSVEGLTYDEVVEGFRLDYANTPFAEGGTEYAYLKFKTGKIGQLEIPYGAQFGGTNTTGSPCTQNGFTGARNGIEIPEWTFSDGAPLEDEAELHRVINTADNKGVTDEIVAIFDSEKGWTLQ